MLRNSSGKEVKLIKNIKGKFFIINILFVLIASRVIAASFDSKLEKIYSLYSKKNYQALYTELCRCRSSRELEPLKIYLMAESLNGLKMIDKAQHLYLKLMNKYPGTEVAYRSRFPHFMNLLKNSTPVNINKLKASALALPTAWQRTAALKHIAEDVKGINIEQKSQLYLTALRESYKDLPFYGKSESGKEIVKAILQRTNAYSFSNQEWIEILYYANREGKLASNKIKLVNKHLTSSSIWENYSRVYFASLSDAKKKGHTTPALDNILYSTSFQNVKALVHEKKGNIYYFAKNYVAAVKEYSQALKNSSFPVDKRACEYRLMRSNFKIGNDAATVEILEHLLKSRNIEPLLPSQLYEMGLERFDNNQKSESVPYFMELVQKFPAHYRADDAVGYSIFALGKNTKEGKSLLKLMKRNYPNSYFLYWLLPEFRKSKLEHNDKTVFKFNTRKYKYNIKAWKKLWNTSFADIAREEVRKLSDRYPKQLGIYKVAIKIAKKANDYNSLTSYGERMLRQMIKYGGGGKNMPLWAWKAFYPKAFWRDVKHQAKVYSISPYWILSIMREESHFNPKTLSRSNAIGLMQILPSTGKWIHKKIAKGRFRKKQLWLPKTNIKFGSWYLSYLSGLFNGNLFLASASFNGGQGNIQRKVQTGKLSHLPVLERLDHVPMNETRDYYKKVMGSFWNYIRLYK